MVLTGSCLLYRTKYGKCRVGSVEVVTNHNGSFGFSVRSAKKKTKSRVQKGLQASIYCNIQNDSLFSSGTTPFIDLPSDICRLENDTCSRVDGLVSMVRDISSRTHVCNGSLPDLKVSNVMARRRELGISTCHMITTGTFFDPPAAGPGASFGVFFKQGSAR